KQRMARSLAFETNNKIEAIMSTQVGLPETGQDRRLCHRTVGLSGGVDHEGSLLGLHPAPAQAVGGGPLAGTQSRKGVADCFTIPLTAPKSAYPADEREGGQNHAQRRVCIPTAGEKRCTRPAHRVRSERRNLQ